MVPVTANANTTITWKSSNSTIASVTSSGKITGLKNGTCQITASLSNGKRVSCNVTVQTSPSEIYFEKNKTDSTQYVSVKKGGTLAVNPLILPSTSNVNTEITYRISAGNSKVATIDSKTGKITGNQAGVVTVEASTSNGKKATIRLNVKIGNTCFDTSKLSNETYTTSSLLFSKKIDLGAKFSPKTEVHMQSMDIDSSGKIYYASIGADEPKNSSYISYSDKNATTTNYMKLIYFGHQSAIDMEESGSNRYIWVDALASTKGNSGYTGNYITSRMKYKKGDTYYYAPGKVVLKDTSGKVLKTYENASGQNFIYITSAGNMIRNIHAAIDENNRLLAIYYAKKIYIYDLDEALAIKDATYEKEIEIEEGKRIVEFQAKNLSSIKKLSTITIQSGTNINTDILSYAMQGFDLDGDYVYVAEGYVYSKDGVNKYISRAYITAFNYMYNYNGNKPAKTRKEVIAVNDTKSKSKTILEMMGDTIVAEIEGIKVNTNGSKPVMYLGFMSKVKSLGTRNASIFKYTY